MSTIVTINSGDQITNSRADLNTNFANLNAGKIETSVIDTDTSLAANSDAKIPSQKAVKAYVDAGGNVNASTTAKGIVQEATAAQVAAGTAAGSTGARLYVNPSSVSGLFKFGGTGADGALNVTSGTTTIALGGAAVVIKNYTSISVSVGATLTFSGGHANGTIVILKSQGAVTIAGTITGAALGATGGASASGSGSGSGTSGNQGNSLSIIFAGPNGGGAGVNGTSGTGGALRTAALQTGYFSAITDAVLLKYAHLWTAGAGGSGGATFNSSSGSYTTGAGGNGGLTLVIECGGALNGTGTVSMAGGVGGLASVSGGQQSAGGGGGGGGGLFICLYNTLTANSLTINVAGGTGGNSVFTSNVGAAGGGAGGSSLPTAGNNGTGVTSGQGGGNGGAGVSVVIQNTEYV